MRIAITGGAGFIGTNVAATWAERGADVVLLDNLSRSGVETNLRWITGRWPSRIRFVKAEATDSDSMREVVTGADIVYHFASQVAVTESVVNPMLDFRSNAESTVVALEAVRSCAPEAAFFYTSTNKVYGGLDDLRLSEQSTRYELADRPEGIDETQPLDFHSPYGCSKGAGDQYTRDYARIYGLRTVVFRMSCIYGPRQWGSSDQGWVTHFARTILRGSPLTICGDGKQVRDLLDVDDLVDAFLKAYDRIEQTAGRVFNIGGGSSNALSVVEVIDIVEKETGKKAVLKYEDWRAGDQKIYCSNTARAWESFGWKPRLTALEGIRRVIAWCREINAQ